MEIDKLIEALDTQGLEVVIGLETHVRLNTKTKLFCACSTQDVEEPNSNICSVCTGQMGVLPAVNQEAIRKAIYFGKAAQSTINPVIAWDRKHYEYPDLPKNYQLTQFHFPIIQGGFIECYREDGTVFSVQLEQVHIEEDAAKLMHEKKQTLVDFNKASVPLIEIVTKPCIQHIKDASIYAQYLQRIVQNLKISEANLEKGEFKSDVSVSLREKGSKDLNPRTEIKNLNSFKFMMEALVEEITKQLEYFIQHKTFRPDQTTVLWDADLKQTKTMRKKEFAADYRYLLEPDIPPVNIQSAIDEIVIDETLLPFVIETKLITGGVRPQDAKFFTSDAIRSKVFLSISEKLDDVLFVAKTLSNNIKPEEYDKVINIEGIPDIFSLLKEEKISFALFQYALQHLLENPAFDYQAYFKENSFSEEAIDTAIQEAIQENQDLAEGIRAGDLKKAGVLVGKIISKLGKQAPGKAIREKVIATLSASEAKQETTSHIPQTHEGVTAKTSEQTKSEAIYTGEIIVKDQYRTHRICDISKENLSEKVILAGWVASVRDHGELVFIDLRDTSGEVFQVKLQKTVFSNLDDFAKLKPESVISATGIIISRNDDDYNNNLRTGTLEMDAQEVDILNIAQTLPFEIKRATKTSEAVRFKYKFLDHRNTEVRNAIINRHKVLKLIRDILSDENFIEIETPILTGGTDEGAREFIVPSRKFAGKFYTLPQAPQQFKQMLMVGGFERYFQVARCFRDEDSRGDRQPEFTQLDMELSYIGMQDVIDLNTKLFNEIVQKIYPKKWKLKPFKVLTYYEAMEKYGTDRPDLRYGLEMQDITDIVKETTFQVFSKPIDEGGIVKCIKVSGSLSNKRLSKGQIEKLTQTAQEHGLGGLAYIIVNENELQSPIIKFLGEDIATQIIATTKAVVGDIVFFSAADYKTANKALDAVRQELAEMLRLIKPNELHPAWVIDFPLFEKTDEGGWTFSHNPFSMPKKEHIQQHIEGKNIGDIISQQYDLVVNGNEVGGGSIRAHKAEILEATYKNMGYNRQEMLKSVGHMWEAFQFGAPPHGGIAWGVDRLMMILEGKQSIREVMAYPKTGSGEDLLFECPSPLSERKIHEANIKLNVSVRE
jgi:aspartyl-tRNA synthetase